jgi:hypothetical protein
MIIGISGKIGSGKDTIAKIIQVLTFLDKHEKAGGDNNDIIGADKWSWEDILKQKSNPFEGYWQVKKFAGKLKQVVATMIDCKVEDLEDNEFKNTVLGPQWNRYQILNYGKVFRGLKFYTKNEAVAFCVKNNNSQRQYTYNEECLTPRYLMQTIGTDLFRDQLHGNVHINGLLVDYVGREQTSFTSEIRIHGIPTEEDEVKYGIIETIYPNWLITDVRFPNEGQAIIDKDGFLIRTNRDSQMIDRNNTSFIEHPSETGLDNYDGFKYIIDNNGTIEELVENVKQILIHEGIIKAVAN